jgi:hypothetical protein
VFSSKSMKLDMWKDNFDLQKIFWKQAPIIFSLWFAIYCNDS